MAAKNFLGQVDVFTFPAGVLLGALQPPPEGWFEPYGACVDTSGNVYIANELISTIDEYSHNGAFIRARSDPGQFPAGCAFDRKTGNLAVSNVADTSGGPGSISIYSGGILQNMYYPNNMSHVYFVGYEAGTGVLWLSGGNSTVGFQLDTFSNGEFHIVPVSGIRFPGMTQWSANTKTMVLGDQGSFSAPTFYQVDDRGNIVGSTVTQCEQPSGLCDIVQAFIKGPRLVGPDVGNLSADIFSYPAGGAPEVVISGMFVEPIGSAVSSDKGSGD